MNNFFYAFYFFKEGAFDPGFERDRGAWAAAAGTHKLQLNNAVFYIDQFDVAAIALQERTKFIEHFQYFIIHGGALQILTHFSITPFVCLL
ncbi:hypothetical protein D3C84_1092630 [compost metagenome]